MLQISTTLLLVQDPTRLLEFNIQLNSDMEQKVMDVLLIENHSLALAACAFTMLDEDPSRTSRLNT